jgi:hypothetical protein
MGMASSTHGEKRNACRILVRKPKGKRLLERPRCIWGDNTRIRMFFREIGDLEGSCEHGNELSGFAKCWEVLE